MEPEVYANIPPHTFLFSIAFHLFAFALFTFDEEHKHLTLPTPFFVVLFILQGFQPKLKWAFKRIVGFLTIGAP